MISENIIKQKFITDKLLNTADFVFRIQGENAHARLKERTGTLFQSLDNPDYVLQASGSRFLLVANIVKYLRFQDFGVRKLYTRPLFGAFRHTYGELRYGLTEEIKENIRKQLENAVKSE